MVHVTSLENRSIVLLPTSIGHLNQLSILNLTELFTSSFIVLIATFNYIFIWVFLEYPSVFSFIEYPSCPLGEQGLFMSV